MPATKEKQWKPPKNWEGEHTTTLQDGETVDVFTGTRTYPDGTAQEVVAHSNEEFDANVKATDEIVTRKATQKHQALQDEIHELQARIKTLKDQAKQYDWAV